MATMIPSRPSKEMSDISQASKCISTTADTVTCFLSLPSELRNKIYELILLHQEPIATLNGYNRQQKLTPGLFRTNKVIHGEASSIFYGQNCFDFTKSTTEEVVSFLDQIGSNNAGYIRRIFIEFPMFFYLDSGNVALNDGSFSILTSIQSRCANLSTLTTSLDSTNDMEVRLDGLDNHNLAAEVLKLVDTRFSTIPSLQEIILEVYEDGPSDYIRREMKGHGWTIRTTEYVEEEDWDKRLRDDFDDYGDDYGYDDDDDYDIDNDSDFWRRAAD